MHKKELTQKTESKHKIIKRKKAIEYTKQEIEKANNGNLQMSWYKPTLITLIILIILLIVYIFGLRIYVSEKNKVPQNEQNISYIYIPESNNSSNLKVNINTNDIFELTNLPEIGEIRAKAIIEYRKENGDFESIEDIKSVPGIGDGIFNTIKNYIFVE